MSSASSLLPTQAHSIAAAQHQLRSWSNKREEEQEKRSVAREGVELYSNGDFYEGAFGGGKSNGSGVYHYFVSGRYDGYGIESWAKRSRYKGQYRQALRHGYGVYRFYNGDRRCGEWDAGNLKRSLPPLTDVVLRAV